MAATQLMQFTSKLMPVNSNSHLFIKIRPNWHMFQGYQSVNKLAYVPGVSKCE